MIPIVPTLAELIDSQPLFDGLDSSLLFNAPDTKKRMGSLENLALWLTTNRRRSLTPDEASQRIDALWSLPLVRNSQL